ncbi:MAG: glycerophosphodiester phosphodiesterase [Leptolyngbyaceae cyanobacterium SM1_1_3]|nr:glycerophosphodiester phosphodiesterase [Leptolyngbyaceae cyanobacterium SM1_1_3]NJN03499.1 glycerophosphodiester phosphodiesterase [Leptolyngbyaceae cyanobacterium RM1_1_2]NJO09477.1 glycerophosphodiester phosphodiesterase [Leptolyngbyaceae cyanobacterium SL_1_1]
MLAASVALASPQLKDDENDLDLSTPDADAPLVIAHRGASGFRPEHTLAAYRVAIEQGADFIEPDLVVTKDGVLIARHENALATVALDSQNNIILDANGNPRVTQETTNIAELEKFRDRLTVKFVDGVATGGWFSEDLTLTEIKELRARERIPNVRPRNTRFNDRFEVPTLAEVIRLVKQTEARTGRKIGIYPETKHPTFFAKEGTYLDGTPINRSLGELLIETLVRQRFTDPSRIFIQSFEFENLIELQNQIMPRYGVDIPLVQLYGDITDAFLQPASNFSRPYDMVYNTAQGADLNAIYGGLVSQVFGGITPTTGYGDLVSNAVISYVADSYAEGIGPWKNSFLLRERLPRAIDGNGDGVAEITTRLTGEVEPFLAFALSQGLEVHPYTLRAEEQFLTLDASGTPQTILDEVVQILQLGATGFFIDQPVEGVRGREAFLDSFGDDASNENNEADENEDGLNVPGNIIILPGDDRDDG